MSYMNTSPGAWQSSDAPERVAQSFLSQYWDQQLPVDPVAIAKAAGVRVYTNPEMDRYAGWFYEDEQTGKPTIEFNSNDPLMRQRFTVAHELAHYALRHGARPRDSVQAFSLANYDPVEAEANKFATELLMPSAVVNGLIRIRNVTDPEVLASMFNTSAVAMKYRLKKLGWV
ncbi:ImmA/IrrE family metallo-endopeptidase [Paraburkholderia sp. BCC1886]|uniref:ImmA/IrrE family metallo-endopeptidase n=1 Tax=Paraburkholderia sp. BCC1886 TaxID=2562670 RepID=UPI0011821899|nr:ImmA/IrrE family metallo-endopeptidase [Paraburkholderia sp. BCC1886]